MNLIFLRILPACVGSLVVALALASPASEPAARPAFQAGANSEFSFDTGTLRGTLRPGGKSLGLSSVVHTATGRRLDRGNGLLGHYRVFSRGVRYGAGAWDWPSTARLLADGGVQVDWPAAGDRPFVLKALYRWTGPGTLTLETVVEPQADLRGFEVFLASYFDPAFTNAFALVQQSPGAGAKPGLLAARAELGEWLMFPRDPGVLTLIADGRWKLEPNPVTWTVLPQLEKPVGVRRHPASGLTALLAASPRDCFAVAMPQQAEGHYSLYLSLFGRDLKPGETARAVARLVICEAAEDELLHACEQAVP